LNRHTPLFDEECSRFLDQSKQAKMQWLQGANQNHADNLNHVRREGTRHSETKTRNI